MPWDYFICHGPMILIVIMNQTIHIPFIIVLHPIFMWSKRVLLIENLKFWLHSVQTKYDLYFLQWHI